jgi:hypothetical protein
MSSESDFSPERHKLESQLLEKLKAAEQEYRLATSAFKTLSGQFKDLGMQHPDGSQAMRNAIAGETLARKQYHAALRAFTDLVLRGIPPPPEE